MESDDPDAVISTGLIMAGSLEAVQNALAAGADLNSPIVWQGTTTSALAFAVRCGKEDIFKLLMSKGAIFLNQNEELYSLAMAVGVGQLEVVRSLLDAGRDVNIPFQQPLSGTHHMMPLMIAAYYGHAAMIDLLLDAGAKLNFKSLDHGLTALDYALLKPFPGDPEDTIVLKLMDAGCTTSKKNPLMYAASRGRLDFLKELISGCSTIHDIHPDFPEKPTALDQACDNDVKEFMLVEIRKREKYTAAALLVMPINFPEAIRRNIIGLLRRW